eukprot:CAMPEP_0184747070 /NCGR_PEP_ID=MMETSP0315-20130426/9469_1 /TAXON_ID=101924 /ORGANISM="Rhodosorus marinus, Strain UTEX LB 2760" /LENGTH=646 /DNA_ID=CAMNT_0027219829 /DNA_START=66 /DNA_END=2006 /DNA_ORIENTATION=-
MAPVHRRGVGISPFEQHRLEKEQKENRERADTKAVFESFVKSFEVDEEEEEERRAGGLGFVQGGTAFGDKQDSEDLEKTTKAKKKNLFLPPQTVRNRSHKVTKKPRPISDDDDDDVVQIPKGPKKRNIDVLMEDLKKKQEARERLGVNDLSPVAAADRKGSFDAGDPTTTNIFVGNLSPQIDEERLLRLFGKYGPIASIKVMWPRTEEERARGHVSGFVAFMERIDAEAAHDALRRHSLDGRDLRLAWGKAVARPSAPLPLPEGMGYGGSAAKSLDVDEAILRADSSKPEIRISIPLDLARRREINLLAAFVVKEGFEFEKAVAEKESATGSSSRFKFLFDKTEMHSSEGLYYRWRVYSLLQNDLDRQWRTFPFAIVENSALINPPTCGTPMHNPGWRDSEDKAKRARVASSELADSKDPSTMDSQLLDEDEKKLTQLLRSLSKRRESVADAMVFCVSRAAYAGDIVSIIAESLTLSETPIDVKIARLFLVSDILHNSSSAQVKNAWAYRSRFQMVLDDIFDSIGGSYRDIDGRLTANAVRSQVERVIGAWDTWSLYAPEVLEKYRSLFLGLGDELSRGEVEAETRSEPATKGKDPGFRSVDSKVDEEKESLDGEPLEDDVDGEPLEDVDGEPLGEGIDGEPLEEE